jgi:hypothetical protein
VSDRTKSNDQEDTQAHRLLHELANDLAAILMRADILISTATTSEPSLPPVMQADLVVLRSTAEHAITTAEEFALVLTKVEWPALDVPDV